MTMTPIQGQFVKFQGQKKSTYKIAFSLNFLSFYFDLDIQANDLE